MLFSLGLSGQIGSGKSTVANCLAEKLNCARASFGDYVRMVARSKGLEPTREILQQLGEELIAAGWESFCLAVLSQGGWQTGKQVVVEGIRHVEAIGHLKKLIAPAGLLLIHIAIDEELRAARLHKRLANGEFINESHSTELQVKTDLPLIADLVVNGGEPVDELANEIITFALAHS